MKKLLFVCIENSNRSQMAQAFSKIHGSGKVEAYSAGSNPSGKINPKAIEAMQEIGYDLSNHDSKSLDEIPQMQYDVLVGMGCGDSCPYVLSKQRIDWNIPDPRNMDKDEFRSVRDLIEQQVKDLLASI
jgi:arsenate reductase